MQLCESYISGSPNFGDTGLVSNICGCLDFLAVTMVKLLIRLQKINKLITRGINERRRKP